MSTCISRHGEYGSHLPGEDRFICDRCFVFDEDAAMAALVATESQLAAAQAQLAEAVSSAIRRGVAAGLAEARLEAVRALMRKWSAGGGPGDYWTSRVLAALSAAPQPEPDMSERYFVTLLAATDDPDEKARIEAQRQKYRAQPEPEVASDFCGTKRGAFRNWPHIEPPASDEPAPCEECRRFYHGEPTAKHDLELGCAPTCPCRHAHPDGTR